MGAYGRAGRVKSAWDLPYTRIRTVKKAHPEAVSAILRTREMIEPKKNPNEPNYCPDDRPFHYPIEEK